MKYRGLLTVGLSLTLSLLLTFLISSCGLDDENAVKVRAPHAQPSIPASGSPNAGVSSPSPGPTASLRARNRAIPGFWDVYDLTGELIDLSECKPIITFVRPEAEGMTPSRADEVTVIAGRELAEKHGAACSGAALVNFESTSYGGRSFFIQAIAEKRVAFLRMEKPSAKEFLVRQKKIAHLADLFVLVIPQAVVDAPKGFLPLLGNQIRSGQEGTLDAIFALDAYWLNPGRMKLQEIRSVSVGNHDFLKFEVRSISTLGESP